MLAPQYRLHAQLVNVSGYVLEGKRPIAFASVFVKNTHTGTYTNEDGYFLLSIPSDADSLTASCVGYGISTKRLKNYLVFELNRVDHPIEEVVVTSFSAKGLVEMAVKAIPKNYPTSPVLLKTFFREKLFVNDSLEYYAEASYLVQKSYRKSFADKNFIDKNRAFRFRKDTTILIALNGGIVADYLKNPETNFGSDFLRNHTFSFSLPVLVDGRNAFVVKVVPKQGFKGNGVEGELYIDRQTYAFLKIDFSYYYHKPDKYSVVKQEYSASYRCVGARFFPSFFSLTAEKYYREHGHDYRANATTICTVTGLDTVLKRVENRTLFVEGTSLEHYPSSYDTTFWSETTTLLPDRELEKELLRIRQNSIVQKPKDVVSSGETTVPEELYHPHITVCFSNQTPNNLRAFNEMYGSLNSTVIIRLRQTSSIPLGILLAPVYTVCVGVPFQAVESERMLLSTSNMKASYIPTIVNATSSAYCHGFTNLQMQQYKDYNYANFMRLHTIRNDANYLSIKLIEEKVALADLGNKKVGSEFFRSFYFELFFRRTFYGLLLFPNMNFDEATNSLNWRERSQPLLKDRPKSFAKYLFHPEESYHRVVVRKDQHSDERRFLTRAAYTSLLNLVSPQAIGIKPFRLTSNLRFTFSLGYLLVPFGEMYEQNIWVYTTGNTIGVYLREYSNHEAVSGGVGIKLFRYPITKKLTVDTAIDYWRQPRSLSYFDRRFSDGFGVGQTFRFDARTDSYNHNGDIRLFAGYEFKTSGYQTQNLNLGRDFSAFIGVSYNFPAFK